MRGGIHAKRLRGGRRDGERDGGRGKWVKRIDPEVQGWKVSMDGELFGNFKRKKVVNVQRD